MSRAISKVGKKLCYPDAPANWVRNMVEFIEGVQNYLPKKRILYEPTQKLYTERRSRYGIGIQKDAVKLEEYEDDEKYCFYRLRCRYKDEFAKKYSGLALAWRIGYKNVEKLFPDCNYRDGDDDDYQNNKVGKSVDVVSMLNTSGGYLIRGNGDKVDIGTSLKGKNVLVCCFDVPVFWSDSQTNTLRGISTYYSACKGSDYEYELVIVAKMRPNWEDDKDAFEHFLSGFPSSCLAIPFEDTLVRNSVCENLGLKTCPVRLFVRNDQKVVSHDGFSGYGFGLLHSCLHFPLDSWARKGFTLDSFLDSDFVYKIKSNCTSTNLDDMWDDKVSVCELKEKLVGLYFCYDGTFIRTLDLISRECQARNLEFEIVMVYFPYGEIRESVDPRYFIEAINQVLRNLNILSTNSNWWVSPFNDSLSRRIWEWYDYFDEDKLIISDPHMNYTDSCGKFVFDLYGIDGYPFTSEVIVNKEIEAVRETTLESLLVYGSRDYVLRMNFNNDICDAEKIPIVELRGKTILLYVCKSSFFSRRYYDFLDWYDCNKTARLSDFDVVFLSTDEQSYSLLETSWLVCPYDPQYAQFVEAKILKGYGEALIAFGKDGQIITLEALDLLNSYGPNGFPSFEWYSGLRNEVIDHLSHVERIYNIDWLD